MGKIDFIMSVDIKSIMKALDSRKVFVAMLAVLVLASGVGGDDWHSGGDGWGDEIDHKNYCSLSAYNG